MIMQVLLSLLLGMSLVYAVLCYRRIPVVALGMGFVALIGTYFVWFPEHSTVIAHAIGVGRGADLILYLWMALSLLIALNIHLQLRAQFEAITMLTRQLALSEPIVESSPSSSLGQPNDQRQR